MVSEVLTFTVLLDAGLSISLRIPAVLIALPTAHLASTIHYYLELQLVKIQLTVVSLLLTVFVLPPIYTSQLQQLSELLIQPWLGQNLVS